MNARLSLGSALLLLVASGCDKPSDPAPKGNATAEPPATVASAVPTVSAAPSASAVASGTAAATAAATAATAKPSAAASASAKASASAAVASASASAAPPAKPAASRTAGSHFTVDFVAPGDCKSGARCNASLTLRALEGYHINNEYPYKFIANDAANVDFLGKEGKTYSKAGGEFAKTGETTAQMSVPFQGKAAGTAKLSGTFKMSVCSEANCQIETPSLALDVPIQ